MEDKLEKIDDKVRALELEVHLAKGKLEEASSLAGKIAVVEKRIENYDRIKWFLLAVAIFFGASGGLGWKQLNLAYKKIEELEKQSKTVEDKFVALTSKVDITISLISEAEKKGIDGIVTAASEVKEQSLNDIEERILELQSQYSPSSTISSNDLSAALQRVDDLEKGLKNGRFYIKAKGLSILNKNDESVISLISNSEANGQISVNYSSGQSVISLGSSNAGNGVIKVGNSENDRLIALQSDKDGGTLLLFEKDGGKRTVQLNSGNNGGTLLLFDKESGTQTTQLYTGNNGGSLLLFDKESGTKTTQLNSGDNGGTLLLFGKDSATQTTQLSSTENGGSLILFRKNDETQTAILSIDDDGGYMRLTDENGKISSLLSNQKNGDGFIKLYSNSGGKNKAITPEK